MISQTMHSGEKLRDLLKVHGDFASMEMQCKKHHRKVFGQTKKGGWYTRHYLLNVCHWTKSLKQITAVGVMCVICNLA